METVNEVSLILQLLLTVVALAVFVAIIWLMKSFKRAGRSLARAHQLGFEGLSFSNALNETSFLVNPSSLATNYLYGAEDRGYARGSAGLSPHELSQTLSEGYHEHYQHGYQKGFAEYQRRLDESRRTRQPC